MLPRHRIAVSLAATSAAIVIAGTAHAQAFYLQEQAARGAGRAFSGEAADTGAASSWWNPAAIAGITQTEVTVSASVILPKGDVVDNGTLIRRPGGTPSPVGGASSSADPIEKGLLPSGAVAVPLNDRLAVGLAVTSPYSLITNYPADSWARYSADRTYLRTFDIQPSVAVALTDWLRVGGAANIQHVDASLSNALPNLAAALPDGSQTLAGGGWDVGWSAGVQLHNDWATVGISYKSSIKHRLSVDLTVAGLVGPLAGQNRTIDDIDANFSTPAQIIVGGRFRVTDALTLNAQTIRYTWDRFDAIRLGAPLNAVLPENYRNMWSYATGLDYAVSPRVTLRGGVQRTLTPTRDGERDARVPDSNRWNYAAGGSFDVTPNFSLDAAAAYIDFADTTIDRATAAYPGTPVQTTILMNGRLQDAHAVVLSLGGRFRF